MPLKKIKGVKATKDVGSWFYKGKKYKCIGMSKNGLYYKVINQMGDVHEISPEFARKNKMRAIV